MVYLSILTSIFGQWYIAFTSVKHAFQLASASVWVPEIVALKLSEIGEACKRWAVPFLDFLNKFGLFERAGRSMRFIRMLFSAGFARVDRQRASHGKTSRFQMLSDIWQRCFLNIQHIYGLSRLRTYLTQLLRPSKVVFAFEFKLINNEFFLLSRCVLRNFSFDELVK